MKMTQEELNEIVRKHNLWLNDEEGGERAYLSRMDLSGAYLSCADLSRANLSRMDLSGANLYGAYLSGANLSRADLSGAYLSGANLSGANLSGANLSRADLSGANLYGAYLSGANLYGAYLSGADLSDADLPGANLYGAYLSGAKELPYIPMTCPDAGSFVGWKKVGQYIIKLQIPARAKRSSAAGRKCRCEFAKVLKIENKDGTDSGLPFIKNNNYGETIYTVGEVVKPDFFDENRFVECSHGIHFFINREEAVRY